MNKSNKQTKVSVPLPEAHKRLRFLSKSLELGNILDDVTLYMKCKCLESQRLEHLRVSAGLVASLL